MQQQKHIKEVLDRSVTNMEWNLADIKEEINICNQLCSEALNRKNRHEKLTL